MHILTNKRIVGLAVLLTVLLGLLVAAWRGSDAARADGEDLASADAVVEERVRVLEERINALTGQEEWDGNAIWLLQQERHALCDALVVLPEVEHSAFVEDTCSATLRDLREDGDIDNEGVTRPEDLVGAASG